MSRIDELIREHCPDGVHTQPLSELASYVRGVTYGKNDEQENGPLRVLRSNNITLASNTLNFDDVKHVSANVRVRDNQRLYTNDILISAASGSKAHVGKVAFIWEDLSGAVFGGFMAVLRANAALEPRFLFHLLIGRSFSDHLDCTLSTTTINNLNSSIMGSFVVPVPPLEVQREIVQVLDQFTQLEAELEAELQSRRLQYEYYQRSLLSFAEDKATWMTLREIGKVSMCKRVFKKETSPEGDIPFFKIGTFGGKPDAYISRDLYEDYRSRFSFPKLGDVLISAAGTIGRAIQYDGAPAYFQDSNIVWIDNDESIVLNSYLRHWYRVIEWTTDGGTIRRLYNENVRRARIAVPPIEEQERIVGLLDRFDALVNDLSIGLPAELVARRKQYEHYRDRLLTFEEAAV